jgi:hypothetical protein
MDRKARLELASNFDGRWERYQSYNASRQREGRIAPGPDLILNHALDPHRFGFV